MFETFDPDNDNISDAQEWMIENRVQGTICPCCDKPDREYQNRTITWAMGQLLCAVVYKSENDPDAEGGWVEVPPLAARLRTRGTGGGDLAKLRYKPWGLLIPRPGLRPDGSSRNGWWRPPELARRFVRKNATVIKYCHVWRRECVGSHGPQVDINDVMGEKFDYDKLMGPLAW